MSRSYDEHRSSKKFNLKEDVFNVELLTCDHIDFVASVSQNDVKAIESFLYQCLTKKLSTELVNRAFYVACFWGFTDIVSQMLSIFSGLNINEANSTTLWTPLHACTFQENGPVVMKLLKLDANVNAQDRYLSRTPLDFASASNLIWPIFDTFNYQRVPKKDLADKKIMTRTQMLPNAKKEFNLDIKGFEGIAFAPYQVDERRLKKSTTFGSALYDGDVLAGMNIADDDDDDDIGIGSQDKSGAMRNQANMNQPSYSWK